MKIRHPVDGRLHWSNLKEIARSPAHARLSVQQPKEPSRMMHMGTLVDLMVFRQSDRIAVYDGERRQGKAWEAFQAAADDGCVICTRPEFDLAREATLSVLEDPVAGRLVTSSEHQKIAQWDYLGFPCAAGIEGERGGFDMVGSDGHIDGEFLADLKLTTDTSMPRWMFHAQRMHYFEQLTFYRSGAEQALGMRIPARNLFIIGVELNPPHCVTVLRLNADVVQKAERTLRMWTEKLRACEEADQWPGYVQEAQEVDVGYEGVVLEGEEE